ncbi:MAG: GNAT family N-acetyltransferase [Ilumatobacteraceae bacterium]
MDIRRLRTSDLDAALALNNDNVPGLSELDGPELARLASLASVGLAAELDGEFAGFCVVMPPGVDYASLNYTWFGAHAGELGYDDFAYLDRIAVVPHARRHGIGRAFYARLVEELTGSVPVLFCEVNLRPRNERSLAFHAAVGFREVGQQDTDGGTKRVSLLALDLR